MKLTLRTYYAVLALSAMIDESPAEERWHRIEEIATERGISESFLLQV
ncbi:MAG: Rrf2 family transcriptional regulator, partial [Candidatus Omnitrophica bacterium]|nr:Rrf2 family transcriptional regulator [Candidatus Omnitrophota bacterium]